MLNTNRSDFRPSHIRYEPMIDPAPMRANGTKMQLLQLAGKLDTDKQFESQCYRKAVDVIFAQLASDNMAMTEEARNATSGFGETGSKQMSAKRGIKLFKEREVAEIYKEYKQLNDLEVLKGIDPNTLKLVVKKKALNVINTDRYGDTLQTSDVKDITLKFFPKQVVSEKLSISQGSRPVKRSLPVLRLFTCFIKRRLDVVIL